MNGRILAIAAIAALVSGAALADGDADAGKRVFNKCKACHKVGPDAKNGVGPNLTGVIGRPIAQEEGFKYSDAFLAKGEDGHVWTEEEISLYLADPKGYIPGNKMSFAGLRKPEEIADVIAYIESFQ